MTQQHDIPRKVCSGVATGAELPDALDGAIRAYLQASSEQGGLALALQRRVEARERAKLWLAQRGGQIRRLTPLERRYGRGQLRQLRGLLRDGLREVPVQIWQGIGAAAAGALAGYCLLPLLQQLALPNVLGELLPAAGGINGLGLLSALSGALLASAAVQWTSLRELFSA